MSQPSKQHHKPADLSFLIRELRRLSTHPQDQNGTAFWKVVRWHLRERSGRSSC